ncbi:MAG: short-chain dehydrogenase/reductase [Hydrocarboniphaga sp.]|uniref:SDR family NAD(P)-dependent oxidoreductase n=1 Tax=Hydrocarboniphaga sp. TaxID=2033016 RepID=UPI002618D566|nr:SDR family NAD(P)-dependent oxidoreductase [Hydrocarboniphaga sp.]MDB5969686.1 short-chain dehydrogenase/reductase [Hydrocarboniphaga sp.]
MTNQKVLFITGAGSGLGQLTAKRALAGGWAVAAMDINASGLAQLGESPKLLKLVVDITDPAAVEAAVDRCETELGPITRLTNAAAIMPLGLLNEQPRELIMMIMAINFGGMVNIVKIALPRLMTRGSGEFVSYASMAGHWPLIYMGAYNAAKHAVAAFTEVLYHETRNSGVRIVCVCPPIVATPLLEQAKGTVWPKIFNVFPPIAPEAVLDEIERILPGKALWVFPGPLTRVSWWLRRWIPGMLWWRVHQIEGI